MYQIVHRDLMKSLDNLRSGKYRSDVPLGSFLFKSTYSIAPSRYDLQPQAPYYDA
ncbi:hypothetical protein J6590_058391 [Homalodisca vitripennis]|nr:hypothetical protein J6590_058391 [Homalodisca vitripennis]